MRGSTSGTSPANYGYVSTYSHHSMFPVEKIIGAQASGSISQTPVAECGLNYDVLGKAPANPGLPVNSN